MASILTTHVGSLPRSQAVVDFILARGGEAYDQATFDACMTAAVSDTVRKQKEAGIDIVSDGETSKISYATYVKDRYTGFDGDSPRNAPADLKLFPEFPANAWPTTGARRNMRVPCVWGKSGPRARGNWKRTSPTCKAAMAANMASAAGS
jgi:5-methyltetrahydropteroyltriglutamate--homocysteine methyltransferase